MAHLKGVLVLAVILVVAGCSPTTPQPTLRSVSASPSSKATASPSATPISSLATPSSSGSPVAIKVGALRTMLTSAGFTCSDQVGLTGFACAGTDSANGLTYQIGVISDAADSATSFDLEAQFGANASKATANAYLGQILDLLTAGSNSAGQIQSASGDLSMRWTAGPYEMLVSTLTVDTFAIHGGLPSALDGQIVIGTDALVAILQANGFNCVAAPTQQVCTKATTKATISLSEDGLIYAVSESYTDVAAPKALIGWLFSTSDATALAAWLGATSDGERSVGSIKLTVTGGRTLSIART